MFEKLRRDWRDHRFAMSIQIVTGLACGLLTALYLTTKSIVYVIALLVFSLIGLKWGGFKDSEQAREDDK